jgi:predicted HTH transcriptional regulator
MSWRRIGNESDFLQLVDFGQTTESMTLDFKYDLNHFVAARQDDAKELCRDICQFANSEGGTLLVGIVEQKSGDARVTTAVHPIAGFDRRREWIEQAVQKHLVPATTPVYIDRVVLGAGPIVAINVPASERLVVVWDKALHTMECYRRTNHGKESLNPDEVLALMMNSARSSRPASFAYTNTCPIGTGV